MRARGRTSVRSTLLRSPLLESLMAPEACNARCTSASTVGVFGCVAICRPWYRVPWIVRGDDHVAYQIVERWAGADAQLGRRARAC